MARKDKFPFFRQLDYRDCGSTCLRMVAKFHGKNFSREFLRNSAGITKQGVTMAGIADAAEADKRLVVFFAYPAPSS